MEIKQIEYQDTPLRCAGSLHVTLLCTLFRIYGLDHSRGIRSEIFRHDVSADDETTPLTGGTTGDLHVLNKGSKFLLLDGYHRLRALRQLHVEGNVRWIQTDILARIIVHKDGVLISKCGGINVKKLANKMTGIVCRDFTFVDLLKTMLNSAIAFNKEYNQKLVTICIVDNVKDMMRSDFCTGMRVQSYYRFIRASQMMLMDQNVLALVESLHTDAPESQSLEFFCLDDIGLYTRTVEELPILIKVSSNFLKN